MKASRTVTYAVQALLLLMERNGDFPTPCSKLAKEGKMPERFLLQILRALVNAGILQSVRGVDGGYRLALPPEAITLRAIIEALEGPMVSMPSSDNSGDASKSGIRLTNVLRGVSTKVSEELNKVTLVDLASKDEIAPPSSSV